MCSKRLQEALQTLLVVYCKISENTGVALTQLQYTYNRDSTKEYTILTYNLYMIEK